MKTQPRPLQRVHLCQSTIGAHAILFGFEGNGGKHYIFACHHTAVPEIIVRFVAGCEVAARIRGDLRNEPRATEINALILTDIGVAEDQIERRVTLRLYAAETGPLDYAVPLDLANRLIVRVERTAEKRRANRT